MALNRSTLTPQLEGGFSPWADRVARWLGLPLPGISRRAGAAHPESPHELGLTSLPLAFLLSGALWMAFLGGMALLIIR